MKEFNSLARHGRVRQTKAAGVPVIDIDGSYIYRKYHSETDDADNIPVPDIPPAGWDTIEGVQSVAIRELPKITHGTFLDILILLAKHYSNCRSLVHLSRQ